MTVVAGIQIALWWVAWRAGIAEPPLFRMYGLVGYTLLGAIGVIIFLHRLVQMARSGETRPIARSADILRANASRILVIVIALQVFSFGSAAFSALKTGLPNFSSFWLDPYLATAEEQLAGAAPWLISYRLFGWATPAIDFIYASWLTVQIIVFYSLLLLKPSPLKTQALVSLALAWLLLGIGGAYLLSSAGPIYYDHIFGGDAFAGLALTLDQAPVAARTSQMLWRAYSVHSNEIASGISAMPSMHVALALWLVLIARRTRAAPLAWTYFWLIWLGSVHLGWHYVSDGLVGALGMLAIWRISEAFVRDEEVGPSQVRTISKRGNNQRAACIYDIETGAGVTGG